MNDALDSHQPTEEEVLSAARTMFQGMQDTSALRDRMARAAAIIRVLSSVPSEPSLVYEGDVGDTPVVIPIGEVITVGRHEECDVAIPECTALSRQHFRVSCLGTDCVVEDLNSRNGTFVNDADASPITARVLCDGDFILAGVLAFLFVGAVD